jgi:hypothetical protein
MGAIAEMRQAISQTMSDAVDYPDREMTDEVQTAAQSVIMDRAEHLFNFNLVLDGAILLAVILSMFPRRPAEPAPDPATGED